MEKANANRVPLGIRSATEKSCDDMTNLVHRAKQSTASLGKFQESLKGEKTPRKLGKKRKFEPNEGDISSERERQLKIFSEIQSKKPKLNESKFHTVEEHIRRKSSQRNSDEDSDDGNVPNKRRGKAQTNGRRSKSGDNRNKQRSMGQAHRQQKFNHKKSGVKGSRTKIGKARTRSAGKGR